MNTRRWMRSTLIALAVCTGCTTQNVDIDWVRRDALNDTQRRYTQLVRWGEIERASHFVDPELRDEFLGHMDAFYGIRITDFETGTPSFDADGSVRVAVTYRGYSQSSFIERPIRERQHWVRSDETGNWVVRSKLDDLINAVSGKAH